MERIETRDRWLVAAAAMAAQFRRRPNQSGRGRRHARQDELDSRPGARLAVEIDPATQALGHDAVDDMQPEAGAALVAPRREKRIERLPSDAGAHAAAIV